MSIYVPPPLNRWWLRGKTHPNVETMHAVYVKRAWRLATFGRRCTFTIVCVAWPLILIVVAAIHSVARGPIGRVRAKKSSVRQFVEQVEMGLAGLMTPRQYYMFEFFDDRIRSLSGDYLLRSHTKRGAYPVLIDRSLPKPVRAPFKNKYDFAIACRNAGIPTPEILLALKDGEVIYPETAQVSVPRCDLFIKPAIGQGGYGTEKLLYRDGEWHCDRTNYTEPELIRHLRSRSARKPIVVQRVLTNHAALSGVNLGALSTLRLMTILDENGNPEAHFAALRMPRQSGAVVDNFHAGGIAAAVDMETGRVGQASDMGLSASTAWYARHPATGAAIEGMTVPMFSEALALVREAHKVFAVKPVVGWDVAICEDGPVIVEANGSPDLDIIQRTHKKPLGPTRFASLLAWHVTQRIERGRPSPADKPFNDLQPV